MRILRFCYGLMKGLTMLVIKLPSQQKNICYLLYLFTYFPYYIHWESSLSHKFVLHEFKFFQKNYIYCIELLTLEQPKKANTNQFNVYTHFFYLSILCLCCQTTVLYKSVNNNLSNIIYLYLYVNSKQ